MLVQESNWVLVLALRVVDLVNLDLVGPVGMVVVVLVRVVADHLEILPTVDPVMVDQVVDIEDLALIVVVILGSVQVVLASQVQAGLDHLVQIVQVVQEAVEVDLAIVSGRIKTNSFNRICDEVSLIFLCVVSDTITIMRMFMSHR